MGQNIYMLTGQVAGLIPSQGTHWSDHAITVTKSVHRKTDI